MDGSMETEAATASSSTKHAHGKWGSACTACSAAKAKCLRSNPAPDAPCDRCKRLSKHCTNQVHLPRKKRNTRTTRTAHLEDRLNSLVDLLRASGEIPAVAEPLLRQTSSQPQERSGIESARSATASASQDLTPRSSADDDDTLEIPSTWNVYGPTRCICRSINGKITLRRLPDDQALDMYRTQLMPVFPFIVIPSDTQADKLKVERPLLFEAISTAASIYDTRTMRGQMCQLIQRISERILLASLKSMDVLQALLVMLGWYHNHCVMHAQMNNLLHLAQSQMIDLRLHIEAGVHERTGLMVLNVKEPPPRTNEEKRVALGVWFLNSSTSCTLEKVMPIGFSKYLKTCLADLEAEPEYESDKFLVHLVKVQHLNQQISDWASREEEDDGAVREILHQAPSAAYVVAFEREIERLRHTIPRSLKNHRLLHIHLTSASLRLHQPPPIKLDVLRSLADPSKFLSPGATSTLDVFYSAQSSLQSFFDSLFSLPTAAYSVMPVYTMLNIFWSVPMLGRWAKIMGPGRTRPAHAPPDILASQKLLWDPSAQRYDERPTRVFSNGVAPLPSFESTVGSGSRDPPSQNVKESGPQEPATETSKEVNPSFARLAELPPPISDPSQLPVSEIHEIRETKIPEAIVCLRDKLQSQPGLNIDVIGILSTLAARCEDAHEELVRASPDGSWQSDIWFLCSKKVMIARAKLEKWTEVVAAGGVVELKDPGKADVRMEDGQPSLGVATSVPTSILSQQPFKQSQENGMSAFELDVGSMAQGLGLSESTYQPYMHDSVWTDDMFMPLDSSLWLNDVGDWSGQGTMNIF